MATRIYRTADVLPHLRPIAEEAWGLIPDPTVDVAPFDGGDLNWFCATDRFFQTRTARLRSVVEAVRAVEAGDSLPERVVTRRYASGLPSVDRGALSDLRRFLERFPQ